MMVLASVTGSSLPRKCSKKIAAIGVTYSWLKRRSVRANPVSPGFTASTPTLSVPCSMWRAKIFSAMVIGRGLVVIGGRKTLPCMRATLNGNRPPYSMTWRVISSSPSVNFAERNLFAGANLVDQAEVGRGQHAEVLAVLLVNALDVFGDHQLDAGRHLGIRRLLAAGAFAAPLAADRRDESAALHVAALDGRLVAALQAGVGKLAQRLVEEEADVRRRDLVGGDVVAQLGIALGMLGVPGQVFAGKLPLDELGIFGQEKDSPLQTDHVGALFNGAVQQRVIHSTILPQSQGVCDGTAQVS